MQICSSGLNRSKNENEKMKERQKADRETKFSRVKRLDEE